MNDVGKMTQTWCEQSGRPSTYSDSVTSTNELAKQVSISDRRLHIVVSSHQQSGRGRGDNKWIDINGHGLLSSWVFLSDDPINTLMSPRVGMAIYRAIRAAWPNIDLSLKAPNDILCAGKKICGLLIETVQTGDEIKIIVGIGLNVFGSPEDLDSASHLQAHLQNTLTPPEWFGFLERVELELQLALFLNPHEQLGENECEQLKYALNQNPNISNKLTKVQPDGSLQYADKTVSWRDL